MGQNQFLAVIFVSESHRPKKQILNFPITKSNNYFKNQNIFPRNNFTTLETALN